MKRYLLPLKPSLPLLLLVVFTFLLGGSSRADTLSLILLRPIAFFALAWAILTSTQATFAQNRPLILCAAAWILFTALQLLPLPPQIWEALPGRQLTQEIDDAAGLSGLWRPLSLVPYRTINALFALVLPAAALLIALNLRRSQLRYVVFLLAGLVWVSAALSLLQVVGGTGNPFYTYRITNEGSAVGLLANRNHQAIFLAMGFPLIAATLSLWAVTKEQVKLREWTGAGVAILLIPFLLFTQSRAGIVIGLLGIVMAWWVYHSPVAGAQSRRRKVAVDPRVIFGGLTAAALVGLTMAYSAANSIQRLGSQDDELRLSVWPVVWNAARDYVSVGSGIGTFVELFQAYEPDAMLDPKYINHAHNDWLEIILTGGLPFILVLTIAMVLVALKSFPALKRGLDVQDTVLRRLGLCLLIILALGSAYDYPVRVPAMAVIVALAVVFAAGASSNRFDGKRKH